MGTTLSHPPPLIEISGPRNKVLVPAGTSFSVNPPIPPIYHRVLEPYLGDYFPRGRPRDRERGRQRDTYRERERYRGRDRRRRPLTEDDTVTSSEMSFGDGPPMQGRRGTRRGPDGGGRMHMGMPMTMRRGPPRRPSRPPPNAYMMDPSDPRARSAPDLPMGYAYPGAGPRGPLRRGMSPNLVRGMDGGDMGRSADMGGNPYAFQTGRVPTPGMGRTHTPLAMPQQGRRPVRPPGLNDIPMGAYAAGTPHSPPHLPARANTEPPTSSRLNRRQGPGKKVGPSGQEWIQGDPFLDACTCTTNCTCRKGQRVLYRSQAQDGDGEGNGKNGWGEIRYVLKDDLGRDCGDHEKCRGHENFDESDDGKKGRRKGKGKGKGKKGVRERDGESEGFRDELRECLKGIQDDLAGIKLKDRNTGPPPPFS
ncbi:hypothetical protein K458DRAFT_387389, partial [Lentithecium fluviatile CBS 122367]